MEIELPPLSLGTSNSSLWTQLTLRKIKVVIGFSFKSFSWCMD